MTDKEAEPTTKRSKRLVAYVSANPEHAPTPSELRRFCQEYLPAYMVPSVFIVLDRLPVTRNGKIDRQALLDSAPKARQAQPAGAAPKTDLERKVAAIWREALGVGNLSVHDNFFELGGHSLLLVRVHSKLKQRFDTRLEIVDLFRYPTISSLAKALRAEMANGQNHQQTGTGPANSE